MSNVVILEKVADITRITDHATQLVYNIGTQLVCNIGHITCVSNVVILEKVTDITQI